MDKHDIECFGKVKVQSANGHEWEWDIHEFLDVRASNALDVDVTVINKLRDILTYRHSPFVITEIKPLFKNPYQYEDN